MSLPTLQPYTPFFVISQSSQSDRLTSCYLLQMDHPAALHRLKVGVPATVEHSSEAGPETGKWVAETTQVRFFLAIPPHVSPQIRLPAFVIPLTLIEPCAHLDAQK